MAQAFGFVYAFFLIVSSYGRGFKEVLFLQTISFFFKAAHYYLLGGFSGFLTSIVSMIRNVLCAKNNKKVWIVIIIIIYLIVGVYSYNSFCSILPVFATVFYTVIVSLNNVSYLRWGLVGTSIIWLSYNIYLISYSGIIIQVITLVFSLLSIIKLDKKE